MSDPATSPGNPPRHPDTEGTTEPVILGQSDMAMGYLRSRIYAAVALVATGLILAATWGWAGGWVIAGAASLVCLDGIRRLRPGTRPHVVATLFLDVTLTGAAVLIANLPPVILVAPLFYDLVSAVFALSRRSSIVMVVYATLLSLSIVFFDFTMVNGGLSQAQQDATVAIAVVIYLGATYLMTATAAAAVRERESLNEDLREKESRLHAVVDSTPIVLYSINNHGVFTLSEGPGLRLLGLEPGQVVGLNVADVFGDYPDVLDMVTVALAATTDTVHEVTVNGASFAVRHRPLVAAGGGRQGTVGVAMDITAEVTYRRELENQIRSKDQFIASVSHELRTPLSVVFGLGEELRSNAANIDTGELEELHTMLAQQAGEVVDIVEDLLVAARADIDRLVVAPSAVDIGKQVSAVLQPLTDHDIEVTQPDEAIVAWCDDSRSRQILRNLVVNATRHGGKRIRLAYGYVEDHVLIEVKDDGEGVPAGDEGRIFDAYHSSKAAAGSPASIGLGLTVARTLARLMNGDLSYARRDGWSVFSLTLPAAESAS